jgi:hypothetical protein
MSQAARVTAPVPSGDPRLIRWRRAAPHVPLAIGILALLAIAAFDLGPALPFNDDWGMAWSARHLIEKHALVIFPVQSALALVQTVVSWVVLLGHTDQRLLRLSVLPFVVLAAVSAYAMARSLGADRFWSTVAGVTLLATPLYLTSATSYMSDVPYVGLLMASTAAGLRWVKTGDGRWACVVFAALCPFQRQLGVTLPLAITVGLLAASRRRPFTRRDWMSLAALWAAVGVAALLPVITGVAPPTQANRVLNILHVSPARAALPLVYFPAMLGLVMMPFAGAIVFAAKMPKPIATHRRADRLLLLGLTVVVAAGLADGVFTLLHQGQGFFPGNVWMPQGFTPILDGSKVSPFPLPVFVLVELLAAATFTILLLLRRDLWRIHDLGPSHVLLLAVSASQLLPLVLLQTTLFDRYYLPVLAPLLPLAAWRATSTRWRPAAAWAIGCLLLGVGLYIVGEQDYQAWQAARSAAAALAFRQYPTTSVDAGYEANALAVEIPSYEASGTILGGLARSAFDPDYAQFGPLHPIVRLEYAAIGDRRPGVDYHALTSSGRIVLARP